MGPTISLSFNGTMTVQVVSGPPTVSAVDFFTGDISNNDVSTYDPNANVASSTTAVDRTLTLEAGRHVFLVSILSLDDVDNAVFTVGGVAPTRIGLGTNTAGVGTIAYVYDVPAGGDYLVSVATSGETSVNKAVQVLKVTDTAIVTASGTPPSANTNAVILALTQTLNLPAYAPDGGSGLTVLGTGDLRTNDEIWVGQWDAPDADITEDASFAGNATDFGAVFVTVA